MASHKVLGVVTRAVNYRDHDRILTLVTRERGKLTATARGCRKPQSKLLTAASPFCYGEYVLNERNGRFYVSQCTVRETFYNLRLRPEALYAATLVCGVAEEFANPEEPYLKQFSLLLHGLSLLSREEIPVEGALAFYLAKMLDFEGYRLVTERCGICGRTDNLKYMDLERGGAVCGTCGFGRMELFPLPERAMRLLAVLPQMPSSAYDGAGELLAEYGKDLEPLLEAYVRGIVPRRLPPSKVAYNFHAELPQ